MTSNHADRADIVDLLHRFARALDGCDWTAYRAVFTDQFHLDYSSWRAEHLGTRRADDWVDHARTLFPGLTATRHALSNPVVTVAGDRGRIRVNVCADHVLVDGGRTEVFTVNGRYDDGCVRTDGGWRIDEKRLDVDWTIGDPEVLAAARARVATGDPSVLRRVAG